MASIIRVKRSSGTNIPASLQWGEIAYVTGIGSYGGLNQYKDRVFIGDDGTNVLSIGGRYYTSMMDHQPGMVDGVTNTRNTDGGIVAIMDNNRKVNQWNVDNLRLDENTLSSTNNDGNIILDPNGTGSIVVPDDTFLSFGSDLDAKIEYDENGDNVVKVTGATWDFGTNLNVSGVSTFVGLATFGNSVYVANQLYVGGVNISGGSSIGADIVTRNISASGLSTFTGLIDANGGADISGQVTLNNTLSVSGVSTLGITTSTNLTTQQLNVSGLSTFVGNVSFGSSALFGNNQRILLGGSDDLQIYNDGLNSYIVDSGVGNLYLRGTAAIELENAEGSEIYARFNVDGASELYYNNSKKIETIGAGVSVFGTSFTNQLSVSGVSSFSNSITHSGLFFNLGGASFDNVQISSNVISTKSGSGNQLFIDPYPDGKSNEGTVIIKGDLQVDGTTTTVNSSSTTINDAILRLGDVTTERVVMSDASAGVSTIRLDSVVGLNTNDVVSGSTNLSPSGITTITSIDTGNKIITINDTIQVGGISTTTRLVITTGYDTNTDRGISYQYNTGIGSGNTKLGFFGYDDSTGYWTFIPDAINTNQVISGVKGSLDIGAIYLDWAVSGIHTRGSLYFDANGKIISTNSPEVGYASTSNYVLTTNASNVPVWTDTLDGGTF